MVRTLTRLVSIRRRVCRPSGSGPRAELVGSDLTGTAIGTDRNTASGCVVLQETINGAFADPSADGVITQWTTRGAAGPMALRTYRHSAGETFTPGELHASPIDQSVTETGNGSNTPQDFLTSIPVQADDYIALALADGSDYAHRQSPPAGNNAFVFDDSDPPSDVDVASGFARELPTLRSGWSPMPTATASATRPRTRVWAAPRHCRRTRVAGAPQRLRHPRTRTPRFARPVPGSPWREGEGLAEGRRPDRLDEPLRVPVEGQAEPEGREKEGRIEVLLPRLERQAGRLWSSCPARSSSA